jgi:hypothetical protein
VWNRNTSLATLEITAAKCFKAIYFPNHAKFLHSLKN